ncbi:DUF1036 domain-containing protein [Phreatobacter aquaticus]|uniref:DUF1036 domain-containing protein n=1 Tax=Phreatobacter aquaticus TaxID=2570229 RepID=A0A4D7QT29_9HYPH|nr:DUF1036 domain-containing protein [Phreatobacter aquaticus]QCK88364.1 DUF1036 domain-containing protein [Phreatobacter aquaticus]
MDLPLIRRTALGIGLLGCGLLLGGTVPAHADLKLCNTTAGRVGVSIGYKDGEGWTTEGWWNIAARSCETILRGPLVARFYYLYAVDYDHGGEWAGRAFMCTRDKEFTIRGIEQCLARGYDRVGFFEVDTQDQRAWTVQLTDDGQQAQPQPPMAAPVPPPAPGRRPTSSSQPETRQAAPRSTPLPGAPLGSGLPGGLPTGVPAFTAPR